MYYLSVIVGLTASHFHLDLFAKKALLKDRVFSPEKWAMFTCTDDFEDQK